MVKNLSVLGALLFIFYIATGYAGVEEARVAYDKGDYASALKEIQPLAEQGNADAQNLLGIMYFNGKGVIQNKVQAVVWLRKAAEQGQARAQQNLGQMYENGDGITQNIKQSYVWYRKAAEQGLADGQAKVGYAYQLARGVQQDYTQAIIWYRKAAEQGNTTALYNLAGMYRRGQGVPQNYPQSLLLYHNAAAQNDAGSQFQIGYIHAKGLGVPKDYSLAAEWYRKAAANGDEDAKINLPIVEKVLKQKAPEKMQLKDDAAGKYKDITFTDFQLDAKTMRVGTKLAITGYYQIQGQLEYLVETYTGAITKDVYRLFLLTESSPREARKQLLDLRGTACGMNNVCKISVVGHTSKCNITQFQINVLSTTCITVDEIRNSY